MNTYVLTNHIYLSCVWEIIKAHSFLTKEVWRCSSETLFPCTVWSKKMNQKEGEAARSRHWNNTVNDASGWRSLLQVTQIRQWKTRRVVLLHTNKTTLIHLPPTTSLPKLICVVNVFPPIHPAAKCFDKKISCAIHI